MAIALTLARTAAFAFRRRRPIWSLAAITVLTIAFWVADYPSGFDVFSVLAVYAAVTHGGPDRPRVWRYVGVAVAILTLVAVVGVLAPSTELPGIVVIGVAAIHLFAAMVGEMVVDRRRQVEQLEGRMRRAEAERELMARQAVLAERARIARDLHDIVAHGVSVMVVQAGAAARVVTSQPDRAAVALADIQGTGRQALSELRRMLGVLRNDTEVASLAPQPRLDDLDELIRHTREAGFAVDLTIEGSRIAAEHRSPGAELVAYRVVQEALTNVMRHAGHGARVGVRVTHSAVGVRLEIDDTGSGVSTDDLARSTGHGLVGMRERVELYGGTLRVGPRPGGGFRVAATLPLTPDAADSSTGAPDVSAAGAPA